jgi:hypothetical protein
MKAEISQRAIATHWQIPQARYCEPDDEYSYLNILLYYEDQETHTDVISNGNNGIVQAPHLSSLKGGGIGRGGLCRINCLRAADTTGVRSRVE